jgi:hypothetical protein
LLVMIATGPLLSGALVHGAEADKAPAADPKAEAAEDGGDDFKVLAAESIGKIRHEQKAENLIKAYGEPKSKGKAEMWEAIGEWVEDWNYPALGVVVKMSFEKKESPKKVLMVIAGKGCELATARGIKVGSTRAAVEKAYGDVQEKVPGDGPAKPGDPKPEPAEKGDKEEDSFVAGTIYGGVIFSFKDGKVSEILLGAGAE